MNKRNIVGDESVEEKAQLVIRMCCQHEYLSSSDWPIRMKVLL